MIERKIKIGAITSSISLADYFHKIKEKNDHLFYISPKGLDEAVPAGKEMQRNGVEVIVSRKGTAHLLRENLHIPVLSVPHSSLNVITCLQQAAAFGKKILIPFFRTHMGGIEIMEELLHVKLVRGIYADMGSLEDLVITGKNQGCQVVVGGGLAMRFAEKYGLKALEVNTSQEDIEATLENAISVARSNRKERERSQRLYGIIDAVSDGIISVNRDGVIMTINPTARKLLKIERDITEENIDAYLPSASIFQVLDTQEPILDKLERINNELFIFNYTPVILGDEIVGCISTIQDISHVVRAEREVRRSLTKGLIAKYAIDDLIHASPAMQNVVQTARQFAPTDLTLLITGETGTGKEILSQSIHNLSHRKQNPFVSINCAALPEQLLESELFGYEGGAFTGSRKGGKPGLFEMAHKGTILLDEISATTLNFQTRLLRVLQEKEVMRIGGDRLIPIDVRIIANSNLNLNDAVQNGQFREDLFFRLNVLMIHIPPLRERPEDIPLLVHEFIHKFAHEHHLSPIRIPAAFIKKLIDYSWPGNVRQLLHFVERVFLLSDCKFSADIFDAHYVELTRYSPDKESSTQSKDRDATTRHLKYQTRTNEIEIIRRALERTRFQKSQAAAMLGISRTTLWKKIKKYGLE